MNGLQPPVFSGSLTQDFDEWLKIFNRYDCANRIPLASTNVLTSKEYFSTSLPVANHVRQSAFTEKCFQKYDKDDEKI